VRAEQLGETVLRIPAVAISRFSGHYEYSRYVFILELEVIGENEGIPGLLAVSRGTAR
jgi:hypothetical protein